MALSPLHADALAKQCVTFADRCKSGRAFKPAYLPGTTGLKDVRTSDKQTLHIRVATTISLSNGSTDESAVCREYDNPIAHKRFEVSRPNYKKVRRPNGRGMML